MMIVCSKSPLTTRYDSLLPVSTRTTRRTPANFHIWTIFRLHFLCLSLHNSGRHSLHFVYRSRATIRGWSDTNGFSLSLETQIRRQIDASNTHRHTSFGWPIQCCFLPCPFSYADFTLLVILLSSLIPLIPCSIYIFVCLWALDACFSLRAISLKRGGACG